MAAREDDEASRQMAEEEDSSPEAADQKADGTVPVEAAAAAEVDECSDDDDDDPFIRNLNLVSRQNLMPPEWIEDTRKLHYETIASYNRAYDALYSGDLKSDDEADAAEYEKWSKQLWASVDLSELNTVDGVYPVAVYPVGVKPPEEDEEEKDHDATAAAESSSV
ncbi:unnamed protein product [Alopecurus aequalis]